MVVGILLFLVAILAVVIGTTENEASVLYYEAQVGNDYSSEEMSGSLDFVDDGINSDDSVVEEVSEKPLREAREEPQAPPKATTKAPPKNLSDLASIAKQSDPNAQSAAQAMFNKIKEQGL